MRLAKTHRYNNTKKSKTGLKKSHRGLKIIIAIGIGLGFKTRRWLNTLIAQSK
jgi:hypothetical protein